MKHPARVVVTRSPHRTVGEIRINRWGRHSLEWESYLEKCSMLLLALCNDVSSVHTQPIKITYENDGKTRRYFPDLQVSVGGETYFVEVKMVSALAKPETRQRFETITTAMADQGQSLRFITDAEAWVQPRLHNLEHLYRFMNLEPGSAEAASVIDLLTCDGPLPIQTVAARCNIKTSSIYALIAAHRLTVDLNQKLSHQSLVGLPNHPYPPLAFREVLNEAWRSAVPEQQPLANRLDCRPPVCPADSVEKWSLAHFPAS